MAAVACVLTIAGSDSGGGAGVQADLKAFARCGVHGTVAITAVTAQNTRRMTAVHVVPAAVVAAQIEAVAEDIRVDAVKIGMLATRETVEVVARTLRERLPGIPLVVDPVLSATTGGALLDEDAIATLLSDLLPLTSVLTPNLLEARALLGVGDGIDDAALARGLLALGPHAVVLTGGHRARGGDLYVDAEETVELAGERHAVATMHGSGCTHSALLAAHLALGRTPRDAASAAATITAAAIRDGLDEIGAGAGPVDVVGLREAGDR